jgi:hypothetical protein
LEYTNSEDSQEEEGQEGSENGDEFAGTMQVKEALRTYDFEEDVSARDQNAKGPMANRNRYKSNSIKNPIGSQA